MKTFSIVWRIAIKVFLLSPMAFLACSVQTEKCTDVNQDKIYQAYTVTHEVPDNTTSASAQFRFGGVTGTTLEMDGKCSVSHDSISLSKDALSGILGTSYGGSKSGSVEKNRFEFPFQHVYATHHFRASTDLTPSVK